MDNRKSLRHKRINYKRLGAWNRKIITKKLARNCFTKEIKS
jgi:hypothetical protein